MANHPIEKIVGVAIDSQTQYGGINLRQYAFKNKAGVLAEAVLLNTGDLPEEINGFQSVKATGANKYLSGLTPEKLSRLDEMFKTI